MFPRSGLWWITTVCERRILHAAFVRFAFVSLVSLNGCITMHDEKPQIFVEILYNPIQEFLNKFRLAIIIGSANVLSHWT